MYHISLCFSCVALFGPGVRGWNKADPVLKLTGSPKPEPEGSPPQPRPDRGRVRQRCSLLRASEGEKKKHNREGYLVLLWPLKPSEMKRLSIFTRRGRPLQHRTPVWASKLSRNFNQRQITVYCVVYSAPSPQSEGAKGQKYCSITQTRNGVASSQTVSEALVVTVFLNSLRDYVRVVRGGKSLMDLPS